MSKKTAPTLTVTKEVKLQLGFKGAGFLGDAYYHQTATADDVQEFVRVAVDYFGSDAAVEVREGKLIATRTHTP